MKIKADAVSAIGGTLLKVRCPHCRRNGTFEPVAIQDLHLPNLNVIVGLRRCPDPSCHGLVLFVNRAGKLEETFPAERIDFDSTNVPAKVLATLEEAITCHANQCFTAAAIMIRKTLEELCEERGAAGNNLRERIIALGTKVILPPELLQGLDDLRLLGNDAAHLESKVYDKIGKEELEIAIEFTKEVLKGVYQYSALLTKLRSLKKPPQTTP